MDGIEQAAILMLGMGESNAAQVLRHLEPRQVQKVGAAMSSIGTVSKHQIKDVLVEFLNSIDQLSSLTVDPEEYVRNILIEALGEANAAPVIDRILVSDSDNGLNRLKWLDARVIADVIRNEHPQIIATILTYLDSEQSAEVVSWFAAEKRAEILLRMCNIDTLKPEAITELGQVMEKQLSKQNIGKSSSVGGIKSVADVINYLDDPIENEVLEKIKEWDETLCNHIRDSMFMFENLIDVDDRSMQTLLRDIPSEQLLLAMKGATEAVKEKIFNNMSKRAADILRDDLSVQGPVKVSEVEKAQKEILGLARKMAEEGTISLGKKGKDAMI